MLELKDVEGFVNIDLDTLASFDTYDSFLDFCADGVGYPLLMNIDTEPVAINKDKTIRIKVTGQVEYDAEDESSEA